MSTATAGGLSTRELSDRLGVSYRQLDYLARNVPGGDLAGAAGSGSRRRWPASLVGRLTLATHLAGVSGRPWRDMALSVLHAGEPPAAVGWVLLDDLGDVHYAVDHWELARLVARGNGGIVSRYTLR
jgi:hypothetical protein